jgi:hypothetical protein
LSGPYVLKRLAAVRDALRRKPFKVSDANRALKEAVSKVVINPQAGSPTPRRATVFRQAIRGRWPLGLRWLA